MEERFTHVNKTLNITNETKIPIAPLCIIANKVTGICRALMKTLLYKRDLVKPLHFTIIPVCERTMAVRDITRKYGRSIGISAQISPRRIRKFSDPIFAKIMTIKTRGVQAKT
jgi:hypothetical protein